MSSEDEIQQKILAEMTTLRSDLNRLRQELPTSVAEIKAEVRDVKIELRDVKAELRDVRTQLRELRVLHEIPGKQFTQVREGVDSINRKLRGLGDVLR